MEKKIKSLWPEFLFQTPEEWEKNTENPYGILEKAAAQLGDKTDGLLEGAVERYLRDKQVTLEFFVHCPDISYRCSLFKVSYCIEDRGYPATFIRSFGSSQTETKCLGSDGFAATLKDYLSSPKVRQVVNNLYHHCREERKFGKGRW